MSKEGQLIQGKIMSLAKKKDLSRIPLRKIAELLDMPYSSPSVVQHHIKRLEARGLLFIDRKMKTQRFGSRSTQVTVMPDGRSIAFIPFKSFEMVDIDGQPAAVEVINLKEEK